MSSTEEKRARTELLCAVFLFGTIGIFVKYIGLPSGVIAFARGVIGTLFLLVFLKIRKTRLNYPAIRNNLLKLCISGAFIGINWILLFEAYNYTTVAVATLCYYMAPVIVILLSPIVLHEKLTAKKAACAFVAVVGMVFVSGVIGGNGGSIRGILLGLGAAAFYSGVIMMNKKLKDISAYERTVVQLAAAAVVILPYNLMTVNIHSLSVAPIGVVLLLTVGILHTGIAYALYFGSMAVLKAQSVAIISYLDPIVAIILSALLLKEALSPMSVIGAVLILGATVISEYNKNV